MAKKKKIDPYAAAGIAFGLGKLNSTEDILALGGMLGAMGAFDDEPETTEGNEDFSFAGESKNDAYVKELDAEVRRTRRAAERAEVDYMLPIEWSSIMDDITEIIRFYGMGEILDSAIYEKALRRQGDLIFVNVQFDEFGKTYCYLTEDEMIREGDRVVVPVGDEGRTTTAVVESVAYLPKEKAPIPLERIKTVIRKCSDDE